MDIVMLLKAYHPTTKATCDLLQLSALFAILLLTRKHLRNFDYKLRWLDLTTHVNIYIHTVCLHDALYSPILATPCILGLGKLLTIQLHKVAAHLLLMSCIT